MIKNLPTYVGIAVAAVITIAVVYVENSLIRSQKAEEKTAQIVETLSRNYAVLHDAVSDNDKILFQIQTSFSGFGLKLDSIDSKVDKLSGSYVTTAYFDRKFDKNEMMSNAKLERLGNVMYNDRLQQQAKIDGNTELIRYIWGALQLDGFKNTNFYKDKVELIKSK